MLIKIFVYGAIGFAMLVSSCGNKNQQLCACIEAGDVVNQLSASFFNREVTLEGKDSLAIAILQRDEICAPFLSMDTSDLQEAKSKCVQLNIETN